MEKEKIIDIKGLTKKFGDFVAVDNITFDVRKGEIFGFLGANGAGKTTAMKILCGLSKPTSGEGYVAGYSINGEPEKIKRHIGYMSQKFSLYSDLKVWENIRLFGGIYGLKRREIAEKTEAIITSLGMQEWKDALVGSIPQGWKQKLAFSIAMIHEPQIVFLDEPTGGVDPETRRKFWEMIYDASGRGITIFVTTHYMDEAEYCDRVSVMVDGHIKAIDSPKNLKTACGVDNMDAVFRKLAGGALRQ